MSDSARFSRIADGLLIILFLALTFLLGAFPLKDTDFYWHLRTGDLIRQTGKVPRFDIYTFTRGADVPWIDLHWVFQVTISWINERGGIVALNLAKCGVTCIAMLFLITARRRDWPVWVMVLAWLPALLVLGGRMYVRPETLTLLYLSIFMAILFRWDRRPRLAYFLPVVQVAWVNSHGLFVLGPILVIFGLIDAALRFGFFAIERRKWWHTILIASLLTGAACLVNPYFVAGAIYPIELAGTMRNPIFSQHIAELTTIPDFIHTTGLWNLPIQIHLVTMALGALSFLIPIVGLIVFRLTGSPTNPGREPPPEQSDSTKPRRARKKSKTAVESRKKTRALPAAAASSDTPPSRWRLSPFRLLLYAAFSILSLQATRNSHQFAAVVGAITAWNFAEWGAFVHSRKHARVAAGLPGSGFIARGVAACAVILVLFWVGSGLFYWRTGEGRVVSLGEEPVFFAHKAAQFAGKPGMPPRFLSFHNGHASLFEYYHGPERKVYTDPRLEVAGPNLFQRYLQLESDIKFESPSWEAQLNEMGRPVIMIDHEFNWQAGVTLLRSNHWRCVWFDPIVAVFVHDSYADVVRSHLVDFEARHFQPDASIETLSLLELIASAKAFRGYQPAVSPPGTPLHQQFTWLGLDHARCALKRMPESFAGWKLLGQTELLRELIPDQTYPRFRVPFDPVVDLSIVRATYALKRAVEIGPRDFSTLLSLRMAYEVRLMYEAAIPVMDALGAMHSTNPHQYQEQASNEALRAQYLRKLGAPRARTWRNLSELDEIVTAQLAVGRAEGAATLLERAFPPEKAAWSMVDKMATIRLHLGEPAKARAIWEKATTCPHPALREARIATTYLVENNFEGARSGYQLALEADPTLFDALYCLAVLEQDAGNAPAAYDLALKAAKATKDAAWQAAARAIAAGVVRFAKISDREKDRG